MAFVPVMDTPLRIFDFDGTLVRLEIDWTTLRASTNVVRLSELWNLEPSGVGGAWQIVAAAEVHAAQVSPLNHAMLDAIGTDSAWAILTNNSEAAVHAALARVPGDRRTPIVVGRERLGGPKESFEVFRKGCEVICSESNPLRSQSVHYVGDSPYEIEYASTLGFHAELVQWPVQDEARA
ncbi:MAG: HAD family hydrolase [Acidimicrobiia bacterium]